MGDPGYDFFATGGAPTATPVAPATADGETLPAETLAYGASVNRFGSPVALDNETFAPAGTHAQAPAPQAATDNPAYAAAYSVEVNRFGSPVTLEGAAPATPMLAVPAPVPPPLATPGFNPEGAVNRFGGPAVPADMAMSAPVSSSLAPPAPPSSAPASFPVPAAAGYDPGAVNHFGTPLAATGAPIGPYAAPGMGATPVASPGMVSSWDPRSAASQGHSRAATKPSGAPGGAKAAGIVGIIEGLLLALFFLMGWSSYQSIKSELDALGGASGDSAAFVSAISGAVLAVVVVVGLLSLGYLAASVATVLGKRWGAWALLAVSALNVLTALYGLTHHSTSLTSASSRFLISANIRSPLANSGICSLTNASAPAASTVKWPSSPSARSNSRASRATSSSPTARAHSTPIFSTFSTTRPGFVRRSCHASRKWDCAKRGVDRTRRGQGAAIPRGDIRCRRRCPVQESFAA